MSRSLLPSRPRRVESYMYQIMALFPVVPNAGSEISPGLQAAPKKARWISSVHRTEKGPFYSKTRYAHRSVSRPIPFNPRQREEWSLCLGADHRIEWGVALGKA